jgi:hypothetical protein
LDGDKTGNQLVGGQDGGTPDSGSEGSRSHPEVVLQSVLVRDLTPQADLSSQDTALVDTGREDNEVLVDLSPDAIDTLSAIEPEVSLSLVEVKDVGRGEDDLAI